MRRRLLSGALVALLSAVAIVATVQPMASGICAAYTPDDVEYWVFFCYLDPPQKDPRT